VIDLWANSNNWYQSKIEDPKLCLPRGGDPTSASGQATVGRRSDLVDVMSMPSSARWRVIVVGQTMWLGLREAVIGKMVEEDDR
jgi:hypothetical protein